MKLALLNTSIITTEGTFTLKGISLKEAQEIIKENKENLLSAIGHQSTAEIMSNLLNSEITVNRINFAQEVGQKALVFKLNGRTPEGVILSAKEIENIGYTFQLMERLD